MNYGKDNTMELKDFIKATIKDISNAVTELNEEMSDKGLLVNPIPENHQDGMVYSQDGRWLQKIDFNVSVTTSENSTKEGGLRICVAKAGISSEIIRGCNSFLGKKLLYQPSISIALSKQYLRSSISFIADVFCKNSI